MDKRGDAIPIKLYGGLEDDIRRWMESESRSKNIPINFQTAVNLLIDRGLYHSSYQFPHFKMRFTMPDDDNQEQNGITKYKNDGKSR